MHPRRTFGFSQLVALTFFCVAGGAYGFEDAVGAAGPMIALLALMIAPWLWSFPTALMTAELSTALPEDGGYVVWTERAFGRFWSFQEGWWSWLCSFADNALYPVMFVDYLSYLRGDMAPSERWLIGVALIAATTWLNIRGTQLVGVSLVVFAALVLAPFAVMVLLGAPQMQPGAWLAHGGKGDWGLLVSIVLWNTSGWDNAGCCAGEVERPNKTYPAAMAAAVVLVTVAYLLPVAVGVGVDANWAQWEEGYFPKVAAAIGGDWLGQALMIGGLVSAAGLLSALLCTSSRVPYAMAERGMLPAPLKKLHARYATPWVSILVNAIGLAALIPFSFQELVQVDMFLYALALILEFAALVWLRIKEPGMARPYRIPFGIGGVVALSVPPVLLCALSIALADRPTVWVSLGGIVVGLVVYGLTTWTASRTSISIG
ncbi:MAG TPA: APC family permease [Candidatus Binatia bacterium]|jgi:amino acid transporter